MHGRWTRGLACRNRGSGLSLGGTNVFAPRDGSTPFSSNIRVINSDGRPDGDVFVDIVTLDRFTERTGNQEGRNDNGGTHLDDKNTDLLDEGLTGGDEISNLDDIGE